MIHLAIDEEQKQEQRAESREQSMAEAIHSSWPQPFSALSPDEDETHLDYVHRQSVKVDE